MTAAIQTVWADLIAATLADAGVTKVVVSPGSRSTPLVIAFAREPRLDLVTLIDERAAAFFALGAARITGKPVALLCTSGTAAAHYLPAIVEASASSIPLIALTADRPPELIGCGASQTIDQIKMYGGFVRGAIDLGAPVDGELALRAVRRKIVQAVTLSRGPHAGPVHVEIPLRKPLEPAAPSTDGERALAAAAQKLVGPVVIAPPTISADLKQITALAAAIAREPNGVIIAGALPVHGYLRRSVHELAYNTGYPIIAEAGSQLRFGNSDDEEAPLYVQHFDTIPTEALPVPRLVLQFGAEPVAAAWPAWLAKLTASGAERWVLAGETWNDPDSSAHHVIIGDLESTLSNLLFRVPDRPGNASAAWRKVDSQAERALDASLRDHPSNEGSVVRNALYELPQNAALQVGNSLPIRVLEQVAIASYDHPVLTQRGAAGIDGLIASAAGATWSGKPVLLLLGDVSFAHDLGGLLAARIVRAPLVIVVIDNHGGQIFSGLPIARAKVGEAFERHWLTEPDVDPVAVATALGITAVRADAAHLVGEAVRDAFARGAAETTLIHAPVSDSGARDFRRTALERFAALELTQN